MQKMSHLVRIHFLNKCLTTAHVGEADHFYIFIQDLNLNHENLF